MNELVGRLKQIIGMNQYEFEKKFEEVNINELKTTAYEFIQTLDKLHYRLGQKSELEFYFVYNNLLGKEKIIEKGCSTCLKRMRSELQKFLIANPITESDNKMVSAWKDIKAYKEPEKKCNC